MENNRRGREEDMVEDVDVDDVDDILMVNEAIAVAVAEMHV